MGTNKSLNRGDVVCCAIEMQGAPVINDGYICEKGEDIAAIEIDLKSKYCDVTYFIHGSDSTCGLGIVASERSLYLKEDVDRNTPTIIKFPEFNGWRVFATNIGRYTLSVCLIRDRHHN